MKKLQVLPLNLYEFEATDRVHNIICNFVNNLDWQNTPHRYNEVHYGRTSNHYLHRDEKIKDFVIWQTEKIKEVKEEEKLVMCKSLVPVSMWANKSLEGEWHHRHSHGWSSLSCIYFVSGDSGDTWFSRQTEYYVHNMQLQETCNKDICYIHKIKPKTLLVFPSNLEHSVSENTSKLPRLTISTNYLPTGKVGEGMGYTSDFNEYPWNN